MRRREVLDKMTAGKAARTGHQDEVAHCRCWYCAW
jgi:hypothetical protein